MFGTIATKLGGLKHVWKYYTEYRNVSAEDAKKTIALYTPFKNATCMHCHSTTVEIWGSVPDHQAALSAIRSDTLSCASVGCHGYAHPNARPPKGTLMTRLFGFLRDLDRARVLRVSCIVALVALGLIAWSLVDPRPIPVIVAMSVAQILGTLSFLAFLFVVVRDLRPFARRPEEPANPQVGDTVSSNAANDVRAAAMLAEGPVSLKK
jgi:hypothetical protein